MEICWLYHGSEQKSFDSPLKVTVAMSNLIADSLKSKIEQFIEEAPGPTLVYDGTFSKETIQSFVAGGWDAVSELMFEYADGNYLYAHDLRIEFIEEVVDKFFDEIVLALKDTKSSDILVDLVSISLSDKDEEDTTENMREDLKGRLIEEVRENFGIYVDVDVDSALNNADVLLRLTLFSNYDCMNSNWYESQGEGYDYEQACYFSDLVDFLQLNPAKLQIVMKVKGFNIWEESDWEDLPGRVPLISYDHFLQELDNSCGGANLFVFPVSIPLREWLDCPKPVAVILRNRSKCGLFDSLSGSGSLIECSLLKDTVIQLGQIGDSEYDCVEFKYANDGYSIHQVYGVGDDFYDSATLVKGKETEDGKENNNPAV